MTRSKLITVKMTITKGTLTPGTWVEGTSVGTFAKSGHTAFTNTWAGYFDGTRPSEWDGNMCHFFRDGHIGSTHQTGLHGFPVSYLDAEDGK